MLLTIVSGGQTGVDRAALDAAIKSGLPCRGWCPKGRLAEDGRISDRYPLVETPSAAYPQRTRWNVRDSDATLILTFGDLSGGTKLTVDIAGELGKPCMVVRHHADSWCEKRITTWLQATEVNILNVAGPRGSADKAVYPEAFALLHAVFTGAALGW